MRPAPRNASLLLSVICLAALWTCASGCELLGAGAWQETSADVQRRPSTLQNETWRLLTATTPTDTVQVDAGSGSATIEFTTRRGEQPRGSLRTGGHTGCNHFGGTYRADGRQITFFELISTEMYCGEAAARVENALLDGLLHAESYELLDGTLTISNDRHELVFEAAE